MSKIVQSKTIQFSISTQFKCKYSLIVRHLFRAIQFSQAIQIQLIQFSISTDFVYTVTCQNSSKLNNLVWCEYSFNVKKQFYLK